MFNKYLTDCFLDGVVKSTQKGHRNPIYCVVAIF